MNLPLFLCAAMLVCGPAVAADKPAKPKPCPKGQVAATSKATGDQHCFTPRAMMVAPAQPAKGAKVTAPVLKTN